MLGTAVGMTAGYCCWDNIKSVIPRILYLCDVTLSAYSKGMRHCPLSRFIHNGKPINVGTSHIVVDLFGGIGTRLAAVLEVGLTVIHYAYVVNFQDSSRVACHHFHHVVPTTIRPDCHTWVLFQFCLVMSHKTLGSSGYGDCEMAMPRSFTCWSKLRSRGSRF